VASPPAAVGPRAVGWGPERGGEWGAEAGKRRYVGRGSRV